jgi:hypothetical protein
VVTLVDSCLRPFRIHPEGELHARRTVPSTGPYDSVRVILVTAALMLCGCNPQLFNTRNSYPSFGMKVDTIVAPERRKPGTYYVIPGLKKVSPRDLQFREFAAQAERAMEYRGYNKAASPADAGLLILLTYGIGDPKVDYEVISSPVYDLVPSGTFTTVAQSNTSRFGSGLTTTTTSTTRQNTTLGVVGMSTRTHKTVEFDRFLQLVAIDTELYKQTGESEEVWKTTVTSTGTTDDLRRAFPVMLAGAMRRIGVDTRGKQFVEVSEDHPRVRYVKGELSESALRATRQ